MIFFLLKLAFVEFFYQRSHEKKSRKELFVTNSISISYCLHQNLLILLLLFFAGFFHVFGKNEKPKKTKNKSKIFCFKKFTEQIVYQTKCVLVQIIHPSDCDLNQMCFGPDSDLNQMCFGPDCGLKQVCFGPNCGLKQTFLRTKFVFSPNVLLNKTKLNKKLNYF